MRLCFVSVAFVEGGGCVSIGWWMVMKRFIHGGSSAVAKNFSMLTLSKYFCIVKMLNV